MAEISHTFKISSYFNPSAKYRTAKGAAAERPRNLLQAGIFNRNAQQELREKALSLHRSTK